MNEGHLLPIRKGAAAVAVDPQPTTAALEEPEGVPTARPQQPPVLGLPDLPSLLKDVCSWTRKRGPVPPGNLEDRLRGLSVITKHLVDRADAYSHLLRGSPSSRAYGRVRVLMAHARRLADAEPNTDPGLRQWHAGGPGRAIDELLNVPGVIKAVPRAGRARAFRHIGLRWLSSPECGAKSW